MLDGELMVMSNGQSDFDNLQLRMHPAESRIKKLSVELPAALMTFDLLAHAKATQYTFDLLCSDLSKLKISSAVAASAAFSGLLSPVTLTNFRPCDELSRPRWIDLALDADWETNPGRKAMGRVADAYAAGTNKRYVHLLDGGIADNLGVAEPFRLLTATDVPPQLLAQVQTAKIERIIFVMVNARSFKANDLDKEQATPGIIPMISASIDSSIDRATFGTAERLRSYLKEQLILYAIKGRRKK